MADTHTAASGGFEQISSEALPGLSSAANLFANAPDKTRVILLTLRGAGITVRFDNNTPTAGANGHDYPITVNGPYEFTLSQSEAKKAKAIQNGGTATGWITYLGVA